MRAKLLAVFLIVQVFILSGCIFQHAGPDPEVSPASHSLASSQPPGRLIKVESSQLLDLLGTHRHQEYDYDELGRLLSIYAPEDYLACVSDNPYTWLLYDHDDVIEEHYEYDEQSRLVRLTGYLPTELTDQPQSYEIAFAYDESDRVIQESLTDSTGQHEISLEYDGALVSRVISSDGREAELTYDNGELSRIILPDGEIVYRRELGEAMQSIEDGVRFVDGVIVHTSCTRPREYTEKAEYTMDGKLLYREREYEDDSQNTYYWNYYYS